jgi:HD-GYP domain-containing protein (c-di-GMP phosphodiesterase class II)
LLLNGLGFVLLTAGGIVMVMTAVEYYKLLKYYKQEIYEVLDSRFQVNLVFFYIFIFGFIVAEVDMVLRKIGVAYLAAILALFLGTVFMYFFVRTQARAAVMLREKALEAIQAFVNTIDQKEFYTKGHSKQVFDIVNIFYDQLDEYKHVLNREKLLDAAILHDIGKINISTEVLSKPDQLTLEEWEIIKSHPVRGKEMLEETIFREIGDWIKYHHERVDGNGYYGLVSENIPLESKIISIADSYSALRSDRAYRPRVSHEEAIDIIRREAGRQFDRKLVDLFLRIDWKVLEQVS